MDQNEQIKVLETALRGLINKANHTRKLDGPGDDVRLGRKRAWREVRDDAKAALRAAGIE
jgi:hypothetical protein